MKNTSLTKAVGYAIWKERTSNGLSQSKLAELAELHPNYIGQIERGEKDPTTQVIFKLCTVFGYSLGDFFSHYGI